MALPVVSATLIPTARLKTRVSTTGRAADGLRPGIFAIDKEWILIHRDESEQRAVVTPDRSAGPVQINSTGLQFLVVTAEFHSLTCCLCTCVRDFAQ